MASADFVKNLVQEVKSQGVFDEFRMDSLADVDTKPAYQNVRNRVETAVNDFLAKQNWTPETNKLQLREKLRRHLMNSDVLDKGVDHIVDQVVNPKVATMFEPKIENIAYKYLGISPPPPPVHVPPPRAPLLPAPPLPPYAAAHMNGGSMLKVETTADLLPTDLEQISPDSDRATVKSDIKEDSKGEDLPPGVDADEQHFDDDTSPSFEPLSDEKATDGSKENTINGSLNTSDSVNKELANDSRDAGASQTSQLSQVSSDTRLTIASTESAVDAQQPTNNNSVELTPNIAANISEEAQMPKFNDNSSEASGGDNTGRQLHFDIKKDAITFEGTERKNSLSDIATADANGEHALSIEDAIMTELQANISDVNNAAVEPEPKPEPELTPPKIERPLTPHPADNSFGSLSDAAQNSQTLKDSPDAPQKSEEDTKLIALTEPAKEEPPKTPLYVLSDVKEESTSTAMAAPLPNTESSTSDASKDEIVKSTDTIASPLPSAPSAVKNEAIKTSECTASPVSSSSHGKRHSKDSKDRRHHSDDKYRRRSRDRERDREHSRDKSHSKHSSSSYSKHSSHSSSSKHKSSSTSSSRSSGAHDSSASKRSASTTSRHESSSSNKKHKSSSSSSRSESKSHSHSHSHSRSHNGSSSSSSKRGDRDHHKSSSAAASSPAAPVQDDHNEAKSKIQKRRSNDSNDEGKPPGESAGKSEPSVEVKTDEPKSDATNGSTVSDTNGTNSQDNGNVNNAHEDKVADNVDAAVATSNVIVVSDILQESSTSFIELSSGGGDTQAVKETETSEPNVEAAQGGGDTQAVKETETSEPNVEAAQGGGDTQAVKETETSEPNVEAAQGGGDSQAVKETETSEPNVEAVHELAEEPTPILEQPQPTAGKSESDDDITHFEENADEFKIRLELIGQIIEQRRTVLNVFSENEPQAALALRRSLSKRRLSSEQQEAKINERSAAKESVSSDASPAESPTDSDRKLSKRVHCEKEEEDSPTPSEGSMNNSKENEALEKHEHGELAKRLSGTALTKLCQQQRYTNDDLYKPRPVLSQRSRRRGLDSIL